MFLTVFNNIKGDDYEIHQSLQKQFNGDRVLFQRRTVSTHVLSSVPPKKRELSKNISPILDNIKRGDVYEFTLRINPAVAKKPGPGKVRGIRKSRPAGDLQRWLNHKFIQYGILADFTMEPEGFRQSVKQSSVISINSLMVRGTLEVLDPEGVKRALVNGIGPAKGLGFGFLHIYDTYLTLPAA